jgi:hypothetical protein
MPKSRTKRAQVRRRRDEFVDEFGAHGWAKRNQPRHGMGVGYWYQLAVSQDYRCAISGAPILFHSRHARTLKKGDLVHPLYAAIDRSGVDAGDGGHRLVCYALHEAMAALPPELCAALQETSAWTDLIRAWRTQASSGSLDRKPFDRLIPPRTS